MKINFERYTKVAGCDAVLRNAIRLDCVELVQRAFARGANINCQYANDWNTPLHLAIINRCKPAVLEALMSQKPDFALMNGEDSTACELALRDGLKELGRKMIEEEFENVVDPVNAILEMLMRNSVEALEVLIEILSLEGSSLVKCLSKAWSKLEVMNVMMNPELEVFVHMKIVQADYTNSFERKEGGCASVTSEEIGKRMQLIKSGIDLLERKYDTELCHDVTDEFLEVLRLILRHLFVVKNGIDNFPAMQLEYCIALYLAIFDRKPEMDLFQLVINKRLVMGFLKQFRMWNTNPFIEQRMSHETLFKLIRVLLDSENEKCKKIIEKWKDLMKSRYILREQIMIRNKLLKSKLISNISSIKFEELTKVELSLLNSESDTINKMFQTKKMRYLYKNLNKTFYKLKQMYSLQKSVHYLNVIEKIEINSTQSCYAGMLTIQRVLQVLGETFKSTKQSPNISSNLRSILEFVSPGELLKWITKLRQYFSHEYSATKHTLYRRLRANDTDLIEFYKRVKADLLKVVPLLSNIYADHINKYFKSFLGYALTMKSFEHVRSYAEASRVRLGFKLNHDFQSSDVSKLKIQLTELERSYDPIQHSNNLAVILKIKSKIDFYVDFLDRNANNFMTEMVMFCIGELLLSNNLVYQKNLAHFYLACSISPKSHEYGAATFLLHGCNPYIRELLALEARMPDENSFKRTTMIQNLLKLADTNDIQQLLELTLIKDASLTKTSKQIGTALVEELLPDNLLKGLNKHLQKYYANLFAIDEKYRVVKTFCKQHKLNYKTAAVARCRKEDMNECQKVLNDLVVDVTDIVSLPEGMGFSELVSLVASCGRYRISCVEMFALETILLELLEILSDQGILKDNRTMLASYRPVVSGRNLRNYLAHDALVYETICRNKSPVLTVLMNAVCLSQFCNVKLYNWITVACKDEANDSVSLVNEWMYTQIDRKLEFFKAIEDGNFNLLTSGGFELKARDQKNRSVLIALLDRHSEKIIHFLLEKPTSLRPIMEMLLKKTLNQEHNFFDDDNFTLTQLVSNPSIREKMTFYLAMKYHHFELEKELDLLYGGAYTTDSLHMAIIFKNEKSALSIIDDDRLYPFCKQDASHFQNTILSNAVIHKLPNVVRRICEVSPELIERTNTGQETPLRIAIATSSIETVRILLEFGAKLYTNHKPPIIYALQVRKDDILELLLPSDEDLLRNEQLLNQLVVQAGSSGHLALLQRLLSVKSTVISKNTLVESLHLAVLNKQLKSARLILDFDGSLVNERNASENTPLYQACYCSSDAMVKLLLERGADCTLPSQNPALFCAIDRCRRKQFKMMLERNIDSPEIRDSLFENLFSRSRYKWAWLVFRYGLPCSITNYESSTRKVVDDSTLNFLFKLVRFKKDFIQQVDTYILANAVLLRNFKFVKYVLDKMPASLDTFDLVRLLSCAVKVNDTDMLSLLVDAGCNVNSSDSYGITPLALAVSIGKPEMVKALIKHKADPNLQSMGHCSVLVDAWIVSNNVFYQLGGKYYRTYPVILATMNSHKKIAEYLLKVGAKADVRDQDGFTALIVAISLGDVELVKMLISCGASVEYVRHFSHSIFKEGCALHYAAHYGFLETFKWMVEQYSFDPEAKDSDGNTALHLAIMNKRVEIVEYLMDDKFWEVPNRKGETPLMIALKYLDEKVFQRIKSKPSCKEAVRLFRGEENRTLLHVAVLKDSVCLVQVLLREFDIDADWADKSGKTAIHYAVLKKHFELVKLFMDGRVSLTGSSVLSSIPPFVSAVLLNQLDIVKLYLEEEEEDAAIKLKEHCVEGKNLVVSSAIRNHFEMCKLLLDSIEFDLNVAHENGSTALHSAAVTSSARMVALLLQHGSLIDQENHDGKTALVMAIECGNWRVAHFLLTKGASKQVVMEYLYKDDQGMNLLHFVAAKGELDSIKFLLDRAFFERTTTDASGMTIGHYAASNKQHRMVEFLIASDFPLDQLDNKGRSVLVCALENEDLQLAKRLKSIGSSLDVVQQFNERHSFLTRTIAEKKIDLAKFLVDECFLETNAELDSILNTLVQSTQSSLPTQGECANPPENTKVSQTSTPPLIQHLLEGNRPAAELLIDDEASLEELRDFRLSTKDQETVLHVVARNGHTSVLSLLLEKAVFQIDVGDLDQTTALQEAATFGQKECVKILLQYGANVNFVDSQNTTALTRACVNSYKEVAILLLDLGAELDTTRSFRIASRDESSALHVAVYGDLSLAEILVTRVGIDVNVGDKYGRTALHYAALMGSIQAVEELLKLGAHPYLIDHHQRTPFVAALLSGHNETAERLLMEISDREYLQNFRMPDSQKSILHITYEKGFIRLFMRLLDDYKLDCSCVDLEGKSVLHYAAAAGNDSFIEQLRFEPDLLFTKDNSGVSPLSICFQTLNLKVFTALIQSLVDTATVDHLMSVFKEVLKVKSSQFVKHYSRWLLNNRISCIAGNQRFIELAQKIYDSNPLQSAIFGNDEELVELFLKCGIDRSFLQEGEFPETTTWLHIAAFKNYHLLTKVILDEFNVSVDCTDGLHQTPLSYAVLKRHMETAAVLLERGANANCQDTTKRTPLQSALENNHKEMVQLLLANNASTPLLQEFRYNNDNQHLVQHYLVERGMVEMLTLIISDIDINHGDKHGMTPLHYAASCNQLEMIDILVNAGAMVDFLDNHGTTPLMKALSKGHLEAYRKLVGHGASVGLVKDFRHDNYDSETILHITAEKDRIMPTKLLIEELKCDVDCVDKHGNTPLHCAVKGGSFVVVKYLLANNANIHLKNGAGQTVLQMLEAIDNDVGNCESASK